MVRQCKENLAEFSGSNWNLGDNGALCKQNCWVLTKKTATDENYDEVADNSHCREFK